MTSLSKEETLIDFLKGLRIILSNALAYPTDHPYFIKSVEAFQHKIDAAFPLIKPLKIAVTQDSLFIDGKYWEKLPLYVELASLFHYRKIKTIEFKPGLSREELTNFLACVSKPVREILRQGGIRNILFKLKDSHIYVEELDYSELLNAKGEELKDVWVYLFKTAVEDKDIKKINAFANNFKGILDNFKGKDLLDDSELRQGLYNFLSLLKEEEKEKFFNCTKRLLSFILKDRSIRSEVTLDQLKVFFSDLDKSASTDVFFDAVCAAENYDSLSMEVFTKLFDEDAHRGIAVTLEKKIKDSDIIKTNPKAAKRIKELFLVSDNTQIMPFYKDALKWLSEVNFPKEELIFDRNQLYRNYCFLLLNLLTQETDIVALNGTVDSILQEYNNITEAKDFEYLGFLYGAINKKLAGGLYSGSILATLGEKISMFLENAIFQDEEFDNLDSFLETIKNSSAGMEFYLKKIFNEGNFNTNVLKLILKLFHSDLGLFYEKLKVKSTDIDFMAKVVRNLENIDTPLSIEVLKNIFYLSNNIIKDEVLKSMHSLNCSNEEFLFSVLESGDNLLKKHALLVLLRRRDSIPRSLKILFSPPDHFGRGNNILIEHINIIEDLGLIEAVPDLEKFSKRRFFWNRNLKVRALEVLKKWNYGKD